MIYTITDYGYDFRTDTHRDPIVIENVEIINEPQLFFEEVEVIMPDGVSTALMASHHWWNRLEATSDLSPVYGTIFKMASEYWELEECWVCADKKSIYYKNAIQKKTPPNHEYVKLSDFGKPK